MSSVEMPEERYQVVLAEGCDTYQIGEAFRNNPAKPDGEYIDIITTTAPSNASSPDTVQDTIAHLTATSYWGDHQPETIETLLDDLDRNSSWFHTMYGVHGIDDNPQMHPWADVEAMGTECWWDGECGGPGNHCIRFPSGEYRCAPSCTTDAGCGEGHACRDIASQSTREIYDSVCI